MSPSSYPKRSRQIQVWSSAAMLIAMLASCVPVAAQRPAASDTYDVIVYGGTSAGIAAAVQVKRMGGTVLVIEPTERIGGLTTGGLGQTDIGNKAAIGGIAREFYVRVRRYYEDPNHWKWQKRDEYRGGGQSKTAAGEEAMWTFEPSAALAIMQDLVDEYQITVVRGKRLDRSSASNSGRLPSVQMNGSRIVSIADESGTVYRGEVFIDATYEGDLMAGAGVTYTVGRESNDTYDETLNGVQTRRAIHHQFVRGVDPYVVAGDSSSGLLPGIDPAGPGTEGAADHRLQAYCFRMCLTDHPDNRIPFAKPSDYQPLRYELLLRNFEGGARVIPWSNSAMPNRKTDTNNNRGFSTDFIGQNYDYPEASYQQREEIVRRHRSYQQGLMWTLANHPRVPAEIRKEVSRWGTSRDEFSRADGWQQQLYIREARRMVGDVVMTQHHCQGRTLAKKPIGLAAYTMDSHNVQRHIDASGAVRNEGDVQVGGFSPYGIEYGAVVPKKQQCTNLLVPVCLSASHIAFGSIRMEPVFMVLGQSSATAAMLAIESELPVQEIDYDALRSKLLEDRQVLQWTGPRRVAAIGIAADSLDGLVIDDADADCVGFESYSSSVGPFVEIGYRHDGDTAKGDQSARFAFKIAEAGRYEVRMCWSAYNNRATNVPVTVHHAEGSATVLVNQRKKPQHGAFGTIGTYRFEKGNALIEVSNRQTDGHVLIDAVQLLRR